MKRVVIGFFLSLFVFLFCGISQIYAYTQQECEAYNLTKVLKSNIPGTERAKIIIDAKGIEEQEDDTSSSKKLLEAHFYIVTPGHFFSNDVQGLPFCEPLVYSLSYNRHLLFQVFRV
jgi:hypothetical protein